MLALDCAASEFFKDGDYRLRRRGQDALASSEQAEYLAELAQRYPIVSIEDGMAEDDFDGWKMLTRRSATHCQLVGDDIFVTNVARLSRRHQERHRAIRS